MTDEETIGAIVRKIKLVNEGDFENCVLNFKYDKNECELIVRAEKVEGQKLVERTVKFTDAIIEYGKFY